MTFERAGLSIIALTTVANPSEANEYEIKELYEGKTKSKSLQGTRNLLGGFISPSSRDPFTYDTPED